MHRFTLVCEEPVGREIEQLAREYDLTEEEVLRQLVETGLEHLEYSHP
ncbi:MAG: CopG family transcriptional regulator [Haloarculaceae archaeon]